MYYKPFLIPLVSFFFVLTCNDRQQYAHSSVPNAFVTRKAKTTLVVGKEPEVWRLSRSELDGVFNVADRHAHWISW